MSRDGCDCPPATVLCAHLPDGRVLRLTDDRVSSQHLHGHTCGGGWRPFTDDGYGLHLTRTGDLGVCDKGEDCPAIVLPWPCDLCLELGQDFAEAERRFRQHEAALVAQLEPAEAEL